MYVLLFLQPPPQYLGTRAPEAVKKKVLEMMYSWTVGLPDELKIADAYQMLKKQGETSTLVEETWSNPNVEAIVKLLCNVRITMRIV